MAIAIKITILLLFFVGLSFATSRPDVHSYCSITAQTIAENGSPSSELYEFGLDFVDYYTGYDIRFEKFESQFLLDGLNLGGECECTITMYSKIDGKGCFVTKDLTSSHSATSWGRNPVLYDLRDLWTRTSNPRSFRLDCIAPYIALS